MKEITEEGLTEFEYFRALNHAHEDPADYKIIELLIHRHLHMIDHMKKTNLWDVFEYENRVAKAVLEPMEFLEFDNKKLKKEVNKLRQQLGMIKKYRED